ncbi:MAG: restriction endonuclease subunit S [Flavobacteriales bacterium]
MIYKRIGDYIELVDERNKSLEVTTLLGLSISKQFIPSVANTIGTNMKNYKIIRKNQFACSVMQVRRDGKMPVALLKDFDEAIISQAYPVFRVIDEEKLLPDYLMMWFIRSEFDRQATFHAVGGVRGSLEWEDFLDFELPIPNIEKQRQIVAEYNTISNRVKLNEELNQKIEATSQALYKHWFVDFEFPNKDGKPYKSSGGEMVFNEELDTDIPVGWSVEKISQFIEVKYGKDYKHLSEGCIPLYGSGGIMKYVNDILYDKPSILIPRKGSLQNILLIDEPFWSVDTMFYSKIKKEHCRYYIYHFLCGIDFYALNHGAAVPSTTTELLNNLQLNKPENDLLEIFNSRIEILFKRIRENQKQSQILQEIQSLLLAKMTRVEVKKETIYLEK